LSTHPHFSLKIAIKIIQRYITNLHICSSKDIGRLLHSLQENGQLFNIYPLLSWHSEGSVFAQVQHCGTLSSQVLLVELLDVEIVIDFCAVVLVPVVGSKKQKIVKD
jgi:hypothetical protein